MIHIKGGKRQKPLESLLSNLGTSEDEKKKEEKKRRRSTKENAFLTRVCTRAAFDRINELKYFDSVSVHEVAGGEAIEVTVEEPKTRWKVKVSASAPATNIRKVMGSLSGTYRNLFNTFGELNGCLAISPHSFRDLQGEVSLSKPVFLGGGRGALSRWVSQAPHAKVLAGYLKKQPFCGFRWQWANDLVNRIRHPFSGSPMLTSEEHEFELGALGAAVGEPCTVSCGGRIEQCDKTKATRLKKHSVTAFGALTTKHHGAFGLDLTSYNILPHRRDRGYDADLDGIRFRPHVRGWYRATLGDCDGPAGDARWAELGWGASFLSEFMVRVPCPGARHYRDPKHGTSFLRNSLAGVVRVPLGRWLTRGRARAGLEVFGQCGILTGTRKKNPSRAMVALEEFENNGKVVRNMSLGMIPPNMKLSNPVTAFYSVNTTLCAPCPVFNSLELEGFFDFGSVAKPFKSLFGKNGAKVRAAAGIGIRVPIGGGMIELTLGTPLLQSKEDDEGSMFGIGSAYTP